MKLAHQEGVQDLTLTYMHELGSQTHELGCYMHELGSQTHELRCYMHKMRSYTHELECYLHELGAKRTSLGVICTR